MTPFDWHNSYSDVFMAREAPVISGCASPTPPQNIFIPPPVPVDSTIGEGAPVLLENCSATACVYGNTVDDPTIRISSRAMAAVADTAVTARADVASLR